MSDTATVDVVSVLEKSQPTMEELAAARDAVAADGDARKKAQAFVAALPSDVAAADDDRALALKKGLALWVAGRDAEAAVWLAKSTSKTAKAVRGRCLVACGRPAAALEALKDVDAEPSALETAAEAHADLG